MRTRGHSSDAFVENRFFPKRSQFAKVESFATTFLPLSGEREKQLESRVSDLSSKITSAAASSSFFHSARKAEISRAQTSPMFLSFGPP